MGRTDRICFLFRPTHTRLATVGHGGQIPGWFKRVVADKVILFFGNCQKLVRMACGGGLTCSKYYIGVGMGQDFAKWVGLGHLPLCMGWVGSEMGHDPWV